MKKKVSLRLTISLMLLSASVSVLLTLIFCRVYLFWGIWHNKDRYERLNELDQAVHQKYYSTDISEEEITEKMLEGYVEGLNDPYSLYRSNTELDEYHNNTAGVYVGIGITVTQRDDGAIEIIDVADGGTAKEAGIVPGDLLMEVEGISAILNYQEAVDAIAGEVGTPVTILVKKADTGEEKEYTIKRAQIDRVMVTSRMLDGQIGYIKIEKFRTVTAEQFENARQELLSQGAEGFIFDVRNNGGGVLSALEKMVNPILPEGDLAFSYSRNGNKTPIITSDSSEQIMPYVVLVNENSASASELFACLMRDYADAKLVGRKTFGKGIMQTTFNLSNGGLTLTTATYSTGKTPCYHGIGLTPDVEAELDPNSTEDTQLNEALSVIDTMIQAQNAGR